MNEKDVMKLLDTVTDAIARQCVALTEIKKLQGEYDRLLLIIEQLAQGKK